MAEGTIIVLAGAPEAERLQWEDHSILSVDLEAPVVRFLGLPTTRSTATESSTYMPAKWRRLPLNDPSLEASSQDDEDMPQTQFLSLNQDQMENDSQERLHFLEHSLALLNDLDSSQIAPADETTLSACPSTHSFATTASTSYSTTNGSFSFTSTSPSNLNSTAQQKNVQLRGEITDIKRIPTADHITRIQPQTITVNLLCAIITVSPSRTVSLRKREGEMDIIELLVGDETRAGFGISFWLTPLESQQRKELDDMRLALSNLRSGDVVILQNVALSAFRGCVYGQSLSRKFARNSTTIAKLSEDDSTAALSRELRGKLKSVREWRDDFVGRGGRSNATNAGGSRKTSGTRKRKIFGQEELPPDTQSQGAFG